MTAPKDSKPAASGRREFPAEDISWAATEFVQEPQALMHHSFLILLSILLVGGIIYSCVTKIAVSVEAEGQLISLDPPIPIRTSVNMTVATVHVMENQHVRKGAPLVSSAESFTTEDLRKLKVYINDLRNVSKTISPRCNGCGAALQAQLGLYHNIRSKSEFTDAMAPVLDSAREINLALTEAQQISGLTADIQLEMKTSIAKLNEIQRHKAGAVLAKEVESLNQTIANDQARIRERVERSNERIGAGKDVLLNRINDVEGKLSQLNTQYTVVAPFDGIVTSLNVHGEGEVLSAGREIMNIIPANSPLVAELEIRNQDVAEVKNGSLADIKVSALPEYEYGTLGGKVYEVHRRDRDPASEMRADSSRFVARLKLDKQALERKGDPANLLIGMAVRGTIVSRQETIFHLAVKALFNLKDDWAVTGK